MQPLLRPAEIFKKGSQQTDGDSSGGLSGVGPFLWAQLAEPLSIGELCRRVVQAYEVDEVTCRADVTAFVEDLIDKGVLRCAG